MPNRELTDCGKCGQQVEIVPAGVSKKTNKPYGSFYKCKSCGFGKSMGEKPTDRTGVMAGERIGGEIRDIDSEILKILNSIDERGYEMNETLDRAIKGIEEIYKVVSKKDFNES